MATVTHAETLHFTLTDAQVIDALALYFNGDSFDFQELLAGRWKITEVDFRELLAGHWKITGVDRVTRNSRDGIVTIRLRKFNTESTVARPARPAPYSANGRDWDYKPVTVPPSEEDRAYGVVPATDGDVTSEETARLRETLNETLRQYKRQQRPVAYGDEQDKQEESK